MTQYKNSNKNKKIPGVLKDKIWTSNDCWNSNDESIKAIEESEIFPLLNENKSQTEMNGKQF